MLFNTNDDASVNRLANFLSDLNDQAKGKQISYRIDIKKNRAIRSTDQNARYWVLLKAIGVVTGYTKDELHEYYKTKFNRKWILDESVPVSTADLDTLEFTVYMNKVQDHGEKFHNLKFISEADIRYRAWLEEVDNNYNKMFAAI